MPTPIDQLLSRTIYETDGTTTDWDFSFSGGYLAPAHVKAYTETLAGARTEVVVTEPMLTGEFTLRITPALADNLQLTIYRDTPKDLPLVDFMDESGFSEIALDTNAKQAVFIAAEAIDIINTSSSYDAEQSATDAANSAAAAAASAAAIAGEVAAAAGYANASAVSAMAAAASAASINPDNFATAEQGDRADSAIQPDDLTAANIVDATTAGRSMLTAASAAAQRILLGFTTYGSSWVALADAAAGRIALALGSLATKNTVATADVDNAAVTAAKLSGAQSGSAPIYGARAWCVFNGTTTGTFAPTAGGNVASVTRNGPGDYTVTFTTDMPDANYAVVGLTSSAAGWTSANGQSTVSLARNSAAPTASAFRIWTKTEAGVGDFADVMLTVFR